MWHHTAVYLMAAWKYIKDIHVYVIFMLILILCMHRNWNRQSLTYRDRHLRVVWLNVRSSANKSTAVHETITHTHTHTHTQIVARYLCDSWASVPFPYPDTNFLPQWYPLWLVIRPGSELGRNSLNDGPRSLSLVLTTTLRKQKVLYRTYIGSKRCHIYGTLFKFNIEPF